MHIIKAGLFGGTIGELFEEVFKINMVTKG